MKNFLFVGAAAALLFLAGCSRQPVLEEPVRSVKVMQVGSESYVSGYEYPGEVRARVESRLGFRVGGKVIRRQAEVGQRVKAGQLLAQLDPQDLQLAVEAVRTQIAAARSNLDLAAADYKRYQALKDQSFISGAELERREAALKAAQAQFDQAQSQLALQVNQASYASLVADVSGVVTAVEAEAGQVVSAGVPVLRIAADGPRDVVFSVPEDKVAALRIGQAVTVRAWAAAGEPGSGPNAMQSVGQSGQVREVGASADPATRTYAVKVALGASQAAPALGSTVTVAVPGLGGGGLQGRPVIKLPTTALRQEGGATAVWVLDPATSTVKSQPVQVATADGNQVVIASGLTSGMLVVSTGVHVLSPGQKVSIYRDKSSPAGPAATVAVPTSAASAAK